MIKLTTKLIKIFCIFFLLYFQSTSIIIAKSQINQIYDGTYPFMKEATIVKEYKMKFKDHIFTPIK